MDSRKNVFDNEHNRMVGGEMIENRLMKNGYA